MSMCNRNKGCRGFTLIELLVVIAIIAMLAAILVPAVNSALMSASLTQTKSNGRGIYIAVFARDLDDWVVASDAITFPRDGDPFTTSTEYFEYLVTNGVLNVTWDYFAPRGVEAARGTEPADFAAINNGWCVVADLAGDQVPDGTPFLFTRNLNINNTYTGVDHANLRNNLATTATTEAPFGDRAMVVTFKGGSSIDLKGNQVNFENFNPSETERPVLRPGGNY